MCPLCDQVWGTVSSSAERFFAKVGCFFLGCHVQGDQVVGPSYAEWAENSIAGLMPIGMVSGSGLRFASRALLQEHFEDHAAEFGFQSIGEYLQGARQLLSGGTGVLQFTRNNGDTLFYRVSTNEFGVLMRDGTIGTYFKPVDGLEYWLEQVRKP